MATNPSIPSQTFSVSEAIAYIHQAVSQHSMSAQLSPLQLLILEQSLQGRADPFITKYSYYNRNNIRTEASHLWRLLSQVLEQPVSQTNLQAIMKRLLKSTSSAESISTPERVSKLAFIRNWGEAPAVFSVYGRTQELTTLCQWVRQDGCTVVGIVGMGGMGKTALVRQLAHQIQDDFDLVIWRSLHHAPSFQDTIVSLIQCLSPQPESELPHVEWQQISYLLESLRHRRCLIVFDNLESILAKGEQAGQYREGYEGYRDFMQCMAEVSHQSCLLVTSREKTPELSARAINAPVRSLQLQGISAIAGQMMLRDRGLMATDQDSEALVDGYSGNPQALKCAAATMRSLFNHNISAFLQQETLVFGDVWDLLDQQFQRLTAVEQQILQILANRQSWLTSSDLRKELVPRVSLQILLKAIESLKSRSLVKTSMQKLTLERVVRGYMTERFVEQFYQGLKSQDIKVLKYNVVAYAQRKDSFGQIRVHQDVEPAIDKLEHRFHLDQKNVNLPSFQIPCM